MSCRGSRETAAIANPISIVAAARVTEYIANKARVLRLTLESNAETANAIGREPWDEASEPSILQQEPHR